MKSKNVTWGIFFILIAVIITVSKLDFFAEINWFNLIVTVLLIPVIIKGILNINFISILIPMAFICILYSDELKMQEFTPWPIIFIALTLGIGLNLIFPNRKQWKFNRQRKNHYENVIDVEFDVEEK